LSVGGCSEGVLDPQGPVAAAEKTILFDSLGIMLAIVVPTILATLGVAVWFRASNERARYFPDFEYSGRLEMIVWSIPAMTVLLVGGIAWVGAHDLDPPKPLASSTKPLHVEVVSLDWKWLFIYPDLGVATVNELAIPTGTPVNFHITSDSVMNSFFIPRLGSQIYAMAGMVTQLHLIADHTGRYDGMSTNFSGPGFSDMTFTTLAMPQDQFAQWVRKVRGAAPHLDGAAYKQLAVQSEANPVAYYSEVAPGMFMTVVNEHGGMQMSMPTQAAANAPAKMPAQMSMPMAMQMSSNQSMSTTEH
jgi:cytochrome o ubiquinol oxidase subunit 2